MVSAHNLRCSAMPREALPTGVRSRFEGGAPAVPAARPAIARAPEIEAFVKEQYERLPDIARRLRVPEHEAEDVLQRSLEKLWMHHVAVERSRWDAWLWHTMRFQCMDRSKRARRAREMETEVTLLLEDWQSGPSPEVEAYQRECEGELLALLERLAPERREVVRLYLIDDLPMGEVAARLGISENTAKDRWRLACGDMEHHWGRERARERSRLGISAFLTTIAAVFLAFFRRVLGPTPRRAGPLLACAACALLAPGDQRRPPAGTAETTAVITPAPARPDTPAASPPLAPRAESPAPTPGNPSPATSGNPSPARPARTALHASTSSTPVLAARHPAIAPASGPDPMASQAAGAMQSPPPGAAEAQLAAARKHLLSVGNLLRRDRKDAARALLRQYRLLFPEDPLPDMHRRLAAALNRP